MDFEDFGNRGQAISDFLGAGTFASPYHHECGKLEAERITIELGEVSLDDAALLQPADALEDGRGSEVDAPTDLSVGHARIGLQDPQNCDVGFVEGHTVRIRTGELLVPMKRLLRSIAPLYFVWRKVRLSRVGRSVAGAFGNRITTRRLERLESSASAADPSYAFEWPYARELLARTGLLGSHGTALDIAAGDGVTQSVVLPLYRDHGWSGIAIEQDATRFALLQHTYSKYPQVTLHRSLVTPQTIVGTLRALNAPLEPAFVNIDIDSFDLPVIDALLSAFRPCILDIEINEKIPPPVRFAVKFQTFEYDEGHRYGCSLCAATDIIISYGYRLAGVQYNNAFFVRDDVAERAGIANADPVEAYHFGYLTKPDRRRWFPWNDEMSGVLDLKPDEAVRWLADRFGNRVSYVLQTTPLKREQLHDDVV